ncbi:MAG TPA: O-antigen ligase family protein [Candidatus Limnocylindrales bacterium]|nr:O-antigen ligase family protein [Candidatus Limnocylindrales bacterium]
MASPRELTRSIVGWGSPTRIEGPLVLDLVMLVLFVVARGTSARDPDANGLLGAWLVAAALLAVRWPGSGLGLAAAIITFPQPFRLGLLPSFALIAAAGIGSAVDLAMHGGWPRKRWMSLVLVGLVVIGAATAMSMYRSLLRLDPSVAVEAGRRWLELGTGLVFFALLIHTFVLGARRPLLFGLIGITVGLVVAVIDYVSPRSLPSLRLRWLVFGTDQARATGPFASPNRLGTVAAISVVLAVTQVWAGRGLVRWLWAGFGVLGLVALVLSFSRGALLGLVLAVGLILALRSRRLAIAYGIAAGVMALVAVPVLIGARLAGSGGTLDVLLSNDLGRMDAWVAGLRMIATEPVFGHGYYAFSQVGAGFGATDGLATAHNEAIGLWAESGMLAFAGYVVLVVAIIGAALERRADAWAVAALGALIVYFVASSFNVQLMFLAVMGPVWLVVAYGIARPLPEIADDPLPDRPDAPDDRRAVVGTVG